MKAKIVPVYFHSAEDANFKKQTENLRNLLANEAELLAPVALGGKLPPADAVIFPQMLGEAFRMLDQIKALPQPILVVTSEFGTVSMWDWEINNYLSRNGVTVIAPSNLEDTLKACRALGLKRELKQSKFLVYQDNPGEGFQAEIFKRFYWWEKECIETIYNRFGVTVVEKSFKELGARAKQIPDDLAEEVWKAWKKTTFVEGISPHALLSAVKIYIAVKQDLDQDPSYLAAGINCLNESAFSDTTPCLAWNMLFEDQRLVWGCEADIVSMLTKVLINKVLGVPFMMTNLYPFMMGMAALKHENIPYFPQVPSNPENYILAAHCGYLGVVPKSFSTQWALRKKVLAIVDENATAIDARLAEGDVTLIKLMPPFDALSVIEGSLTNYSQFENSDCRNGAVIKVPNGPRLVNELASHHYILTNGHNLQDLQLLSRVFDLDCLVID
jgi:hypothetical protein